MLRIFYLIQTQAVPVIDVPLPTPIPSEQNLALLVPIFVSGIIAIATLAIVPIIKALGEIKKQNAELKSDTTELKAQATEIHTVVNSNFAKQTEELRMANERIGKLLASQEVSDGRIQDLLDGMERPRLRRPPRNAERELEKRPEVRTRR